MLEEDLKRIVRLHPSLVEAGLAIEHEEYLIRSHDGRPYRCDLRGRDSEGRLVYVELKLRASRNVVAQVEKYRQYAPESGRFVVAALAMDADIEKELRGNGFESVVIDPAVASKLLTDEENNPALYQRLTTLGGSASAHLRNQVSQPTYTKDEAAIVRALMADLENAIAQSPDIIRPYLIQGLDVRRKDEYRLLLTSAEFPTDRLLIYNRERKRDEIHLLYVPDFSWEGRSATHRKIAFTRYVQDRREHLSLELGAPFAEARENTKNTHLEISKQAWKGLSLVLIRDVKSWQLADFSQVVAYAFFDYCDVVIPFVSDFQSSWIKKMAEA